MRSPSWIHAARSGPSWRPHYEFCFSRPSKTACVQDNIMVPTSNHELFCSLSKHTDNDIFDDFSKISDHVTDISKDFPKIVQRPNEHFRMLSRKNSEDDQRSKITED